MLIVREKCRSMHIFAGVIEVAGGWQGSVSRKVSQVLEEKEAKHSIQRKRRGALDLRNKVGFI